MPKNPRVIHNNDPENPVPVEIIAQSIISIDEAFKKLQSSKLTNKALLLLIHDNCDYLPGYPKKKPTKQDIQIVLDSLGSLKKAYVKDLGKK